MRPARGGELRALRLSWVVGVLVLTLDLMWPGSAKHTDLTATQFDNNNQRTSSDNDLAGTWAENAPIVPVITQTPISKYFGACTLVNVLRFR